MSALGSGIGRGLPVAKFTYWGKQVKDPHGAHFADARDITEARLICAALNSPVFFSQWAETPGPFEGDAR